MQRVALAEDHVGLAIACLARHMALHLRVRSKADILLRSPALLALKVVKYHLILSRRSL